MTTPNEKGGPIQEPPSTISNKNYNKPGIRPLAPSELIDKEIPEPEWLILDIFVRGHSTLLSGPPKSGKSTFLRSAAVAVAQGNWFLEKKVQQRPVLYLALEENRNDVKRAFKKLGLKETDPLYISFGDPGPFDKAIEDIKSFIEEKNIGLVIIDTAMRLSPGNINTNSYGDVTEWTKPFLYMAQGDLNVCIVMAYHDNKSFKGTTGYDALNSVSGSTALTAAMDSILHVRRDKEVRSMFGNSRLGEWSGVVLIMDPETGHLSAGGKPQDRALLAKQEEITEALVHAGGPIPQADLLTDVGGTRSVALAALESLIENKKVTRTGIGRAGDPFVIEL